MNEISYIRLWRRLQAEKSSLLFFFFFFPNFILFCALYCSPFQSCSPPTCKPGQVNSTFYNVNITQMCLHFTLPLLPVGPSHLRGSTQVLQPGPHMQCWVCRWEPAPRSTLRFYNCRPTTTGFKPVRKVSIVPLDEFDRGDAGADPRRGNVLTAGEPTYKNMLVQPHTNTTLISPPSPTPPPRVPL